MHPRVPFLLLLLLLASSSGCLESLRCPGCANSWNAHGNDGALFAELATLDGVHSSNVTRLREALPFLRPELDAAWGPGEYALVGIAWHPEGMEHRVFGGLNAHEGVNVSVSGHSEDTREAAPRYIEELLAPLVPAAEATRWRDAMLANFSHTGVSTTTELLPDGTTVTRTDDTGWSYHATLATMPAVQSHFDALAAQEAWTMEEQRTANVADVRVGRWSFAFWFPLRSALLELPDERFSVQANSHGNFTAHYQSPQRLLREAEMIERVHAILAAHGAPAVGVSSWPWEGQRVNYGPAPTHASPEPTPQTR